MFPERQTDGTYDLVILQSVVALGGSERHTIALIRHLASQSWKVALVETGEPIISSYLDDLRGQISIVNTLLPMREITRKARKAWAQMMCTLKARAVLVVKPWYFEADFPFLTLVRAHYPTMLLIEHSLVSARTPWNTAVHFAGRPRTGMWWYRDYVQRWRMSRLPDRVITVSNAARESVINHALVPGGRVVACLNGVDTSNWQRDDAAGQEFRRRFHIDDDAYLFGCVGRLAPEKGLELAVEALARLRTLAPGRKTTLCLVGEGQSRTSLEHLAASHGIDDCVRFTGILRDDKDLVAAYSAIDSLLLPTHHREYLLGEACPLVLGEAMACGCVVIASGFGGVPELASQPVCGSLLQTRDPAAWASAMVEQLSVPAEARRARGRAVREFVRQTHEQGPRMDAVLHAIRGV